MPTRLLPCLAFLGVLAMPGLTSGFDDLGVPVTVGMNMGWLIGANAAGDKDLVYVDVHQDAGPLFLLAVDGKLWACACPGSVLAEYDPTKPWSVGTLPTSNPRVYGYLGDGHLRPRAMILGPGRHLYNGITHIKGQRPPPCSCLTGRWLSCCHPASLRR
jgi:hypothetical protein